jgi:hypothetical protein
MNTLPPTTTDPTTPATVEELCTIAIAFVFPREHPAVPVLGLESPTLLLALALGLRSALEREHIIEGEIGSSGDVCDGEIRFETGRREDALKVVRAWRDKNPITAFFTSVGWLDQSEQAWRVVVHGAIEIRFEEVITPERSQARYDTVARLTKAMRELPKDFPWPLPPDAPQQ